MSKTVSDPLALVAERKYSYHFRSSKVEVESDVPSDFCEDGSGSDDEFHAMKKPMALLSRSLNRNSQWECLVDGQS